MTLVQNWSLTIRKSTATPPKYTVQNVTELAEHLLFDIVKILFEIPATHHLLKFKRITYARSSILLEKVILYSTLLILFATLWKAHLKFCIKSSTWLCLVLVLVYMKNFLLPQNSSSM